MLDFLERVLRRRFNVCRSGSAEDALRRLQGETFELLLTDQKMPRVSGLELLQEIGDEQPHLVKILISGFTELPEIQRAKERCHIHNYILKPVDSQKLLDAIDEAYAARDGQPWEPRD